MIMELEVEKGPFFVVCIPVCIINDVKITIRRKLILLGKENQNGIHVKERTTEREENKRFRSNENNEHRTKLSPKKRLHNFFVYRITNFSLNKYKILFSLYFIGWKVFLSTSSILLSNS